MEQERGSFAWVSEEVGVWQRFATKWATSPQIVDSINCSEATLFARASDATKGFW